MTWTPDKSENENVPIKTRQVFSRKDDGIAKDRFVARAFQEPRDNKFEKT